MIKINTAVRLLTAITIASSFVPNIFAADYYIRKGAAGDDNGSDWENAFEDIPYTVNSGKNNVSLTRDNTYYIADGVYGTVPRSTLRFNVARNGSEYITIKKATTADHGTDTGWKADYGNGRAEFNFNINVSTGYWIFDGAVGDGAIDGINGSGSLPGNYGIKMNGVLGQSEHLIRIPWPVNNTITNVTIKQMAFYHLGYEASAPNQSSGNCIYGSADPGYTTDSLTIDRCWFGGSSTPVRIIRWRYSVVKNCYFHDDWSAPWAHGQTIMIYRDGVSEDITIKNNIVTNPSITCLMIHSPCAGPANDVKIYNNIFDGAGTGVNEVIRYDMSMLGKHITNWKIHHNTVINFASLSTAFKLWETSPGNENEVYNNLFYNCNQCNISNATHDYNAFFDCITSPTEINKQVGSGDPFVDSDNNDYRLAKPTNAGTRLNSPFNVDMDGAARGADGVWDRGAFEYTVVSIKDHEIPRIKNNSQYGFTGYSNPLYFNNVGAVFKSGQVYNPSGVRIRNGRAQKNGIYFIRDKNNKIEKRIVLFK